jgi:hypothetical protein
MPKLLDNIWSQIRAAIVNDDMEDFVISLLLNTPHGGFKVLVTIINRSHNYNQGSNYILDGLFCHGPNLKASPALLLKLLSRRPAEK